jgi:serine/threonine-protein kinase
MSAAAQTVSDFLREIQRLKLLTEAQWLDFESWGARFTDPKALAREMVKRDWLTTFQANHLFTGKGKELVLGSYVLLEKVGQGGMGAVYKARQWKMDRTVALKVIRKEKLSEQAETRFQREIRAAAQLQHPHIVKAYDADASGEYQFFVMEYVPGKNLSQMVKENGPLKISTACEYMRQAALALQHAYEQGLVHRDIKPSNLLVTDDPAKPMVKVLDLGLVRRQHIEGNESGTITQVGSVMGTPDYISPEQSLESHRVDVRSDLYSLGCTFYYLLTGQVPFPGGSLVEKLIKHQMAEPERIEKLRPETPAAVALIVRKMMAKKPADRYQTPIEAAVALEAHLSGRNTAVREPQNLVREVGTPVTTESDIATDPDMHSMNVTLPSMQHFKAEQERQKRLWRIFMISGGIALGLIVVLVILLVLLAGR